MTDYIIIGGGIIGSAIARDLAKKKTGQITVLEKETSLGRHASGRNSGVIHSGINQKPGSLKAKLCVRGSRLLRDFCRQKNVPMNECGTLVIARSAEEEATLQKLMAMGKECGAEGLRILSREELLVREPLAQAQTALLSPTGATVDSLKLLEAVAGEAQENGVHYEYGARVIRIDGNKVVTSRGEREARHVINCAGLYADKIAHMMGIGKEYRIIPFRGEYYEVRGVDVRSMIYHAPDLRFPFLSIHLTRETDGRVLAGPSAVLAFGRESYEKEWDMKEVFEMAGSVQFWRLVSSPTFLRLAYENGKTSLLKKCFLKEVQALVSVPIRPSQLQPARAGIRAQMVDRQGKMVEDMLVEYRKNSTHVLNAVSPGMTSSLAFAEEITSRILK